MTFKSLNWRTRDGRFKLLKYKVFQWEAVLIFENLRIDSAAYDIGAADDMQIYA
jgi:hypothetical protein